MGERLHVDQGRAHREGISLYSVQIALAPSNVVLRIAGQETLFAFFEFSPFRASGVPETIFALFDFSRFRPFACLASRKHFSHFSTFRVFAFSRVTCELTAAKHLSNFRVFALSRPTCTQETLQLFEFLGFRAAPGRLRVGNDTKKITQYNY